MFLDISYFRSIVGGNFLVRIVAIEEFQRLICLSDLVEMNEDGLKSFIKNENVVEILYKDNLHHMAYVERLEYEQIKYASKVTANNEPAIGKAFD